MIDKTNGQLSLIKSHAESLGLTDELNQSLEELRKFEEKGLNVVLFKDFKPFSIYFEMYQNHSLQKNGSLDILDSSSLPRNFTTQSDSFVDSCRLVNS